MLEEKHKVLLIETMQGAVTSLTTLQNLLDRVQAGASGDLPAGVGLNDATEKAVRNAGGQGWLRPLVAQLVKDYPKRPEFSEVLKAIEEAEKQGSLLQKIGLRNSGINISRLWNSYTGALLSFVDFLFSLRFLAGLVACMVLVLVVVILVPDDEIAIKTVDEGGKRVSFVNLTYEPRNGAPFGRPKLLQAPDADGFYRIQHSELAEPPQIELVLDEANLPPRLTGNNKETVLKVVKVNYEEVGVPLWNRTRKLFLYVKLQSF